MKQRDGDVCMVFDDNGNAFHAFDYTPEALEAEAKRLRSTVTITDSPFVASTSAERHSSQPERTE